MSIMSSLLPLLLFCLTMHACNARHLSVIDKEPGKQVQLSVEEVEKERSMKILVGSEVMMASKSGEHQTGQQRAANGESIIVEGRDGGSTQRPKHSGVIRSRKVKKKKKKKTGKVTNVVSPVESLVSVSWHVSHDKPKGHPGFNLDYAPPKTHPPSHN